MMQFPEKPIFTQDLILLPAKTGFLFAYLLLPFFQNVAIGLIICTTPFLVSRFLNGKQVIFITVLIIALCVYILLGSDEFRPHTKTLLPTLSHLIASLVVISSLFFVRHDMARDAIMYLSISLVLFVSIEGFQTLIYHPLTAIQRFMINPMTGNQVHSTGQINSMALACGFLLLLSGRTFWGFVTIFPFSIIAIIYANRTGMLLATVFILYIILQIISLSKTRYPLIIIGGLFFTLISIYLLVPSDDTEVLTRGFLRLSSEGLETERTDLMARGIEQIMSGNNPLGGGQLEYWRAYPWYHNLFLDAYRVAGIPALFLLVCLTTISFSAVLVSKSKRLLCVWLIALAVMMTSVPVEGSLMEFALIFSIFTYALILQSKQEEQLYKSPLTYNLN